MIVLAIYLVGLVLTYFLSVPFVYKYGELRVYRRKEILSWDELGPYLLGWILWPASVPTMLILMGAIFLIFRSGDLMSKAVEHCQKYHGRRP